MGVERIPVYEDGTTPVHKVIEFLESCKAAPRQYYQINKIITEELDAMYKEQKDINDVAGIIKNECNYVLMKQNSNGISVIQGEIRDEEAFI